MISIVIVLLGCGEKSIEDTAEPDTAEITGDDTGASTVEVPDFVGMEFILESAEGYQPISEQVYLSFPSIDGDAIAFSFSGDCNSMGATFFFEDGIVNMQELSITEMGCDQPLAEEDSWFLDFWTSGVSLDLEGDLLTASDGSNIFYFRDAETATPDLPLVDTHWTIDTFIEGDVTSAMNLENDPWVEFRNDGTIAVNTGCNDGAGTYTVTGSTISVSIDLWGEASCSDEIAQDAEGYVYAVFLGDIEYAIDANRVHLMGETKGISGIGEPQ